VRLLTHDWPSLHLPHVAAHAERPVLMMFKMQHSELQLAWMLMQKVFLASNTTFLGHGGIRRSLLMAEQSKWLSHQ